MSSSKKDRASLSIFILIIFFLIAFSGRIFNKKNTTSPANKTPKPIDTNIIKSSDPKYSYMNVNTNFQSYFPQNIFDLNSNIKFQKGQSSVTFNLLALSKNQKNVAPQLDKNQLYYPKIYENGDNFIDLKYTISPDKLVEEIILNKYQELPKISQSITLFNSYLSQDGQQLNFSDPATNESLWFIPAPFMYEKNNPSKINYGIKYEITCDDSQTDLKNCRRLTLTKTITPEGKKWLSDPYRKYPVVIDPSLQINNADTYSSWVSSNPLQVGVTSDSVNKTEGTSSVKINVGPNLSCWGTTGPDTCNGDCKYTSLTPVTPVYTTCTGTKCTGTEGWGINAIGQTGLDVGCSSSSYQSAAINSSCGASTQCTGNNTGCWSYDGVCDATCLYSARNAYHSAYFYRTADCTPSNCTSCGSTNNSTCDAACLYLSSGSSNGYTKSSCSSQTSYYSTGTCSAVDCYKQCTGGDLWMVVASGCSAYNTRCASAGTHCPYFFTPKKYTIGAAAGGWDGFSGTCNANGTGSCYNRWGAFTFGTSCSSCDGSCSGGCTVTGTAYGSSGSCSWIAPTFQKIAGTPDTGYYNFSGNCTDNSPPCYKKGIGISAYTTSACASVAPECGVSATTYYDAATSCNWVPLQETHAVSIGTTRFTGVGTTCAPAGTGSCFRLQPDATNTYTGNDATCGNSDCANPAIRNTAVGCTWLSAGVNSVQLTQSATNLSNAQNITFWVRSSRSGSSFLQFSMGEINYNEQLFDFSIGATNTWEQKTWDISSIATTSRDSITKFAFIILSAGVGFTLNFDDVQTNYNTPEAPVGCVIDQGKDNSVLTLKWANNSITKNFLELFKKIDAGAFTSLGTLPSTATTFPDTNVGVGHTYSYKMNYYVTVLGSTVPSDFCYFPSINSTSGSIKFDGLKLDGLNIN